MGPRDPHLQGCAESPVADRQGTVCAFLPEAAGAQDGVARGWSLLCWFGRIFFLIFILYYS